MTKDEALLMCLEYIEKNAHERKYVRHAIKAAIEVKNEPDYKELWQQMCERCDSLDKKLAQQDAMLESQTARIVDLQTHIENLEGEQ
jgi:hypothetical protein